MADSIPPCSLTIGRMTTPLPCFGFGGAPIGNLYESVSEAGVKKLLNRAWENGLRYFDTAPHYGQGLSERRLGDFLRAQSSSEYILSTKVGRLLRPAVPVARHGFDSPMPFDIHYDYSYSGVMRSFEDSLQRLGLSNIDMLFMHDVGQYTHGKNHNVHFHAAMNGGFRALQELREQGVVQAIGIGANEWQVCEQAMDYGSWDCFLLAGRYTLLEQSALDSFFPKCVATNSQIIVGAPYNSGILVEGTRSGRIPRYNYAPASPSIMAKVRQLEKICNSHGVPLAAAALRFPLFHSNVQCVIPGLNNVANLNQTKKFINQKIPQDLWEDIRRANLLHPDAPVSGC